MVRRPPQRKRRNNLKVRKVEAPPSDLDLQEVARSCRYVGSPYHKDRDEACLPSPHDHDPHKKIAIISAFICAISLKTLPPSASAAPTHFILPNTPQWSTTPPQLPPPPFLSTTQTAWSTITTLDEWGESSGTAAVSSWTHPTKRPDFPYGDLRARLIVQSCRTVAMRFTAHPNLSGGDIQRGYTNHVIKVQTGGRRFDVPVELAWQGKDLLFHRWSAGKAIKQLQRQQSYSVLVPLYSGSRVWKFDMSDAAAAIEEVCPG